MTHFLVGSLEWGEANPRRMFRENAQHFQPASNHPFSIFSFRIGSSAFSYRSGVKWKPTLPGTAPKYSERGLQTARAGSLYAT